MRVFLVVHGEDGKKFQMFIDLCEPSDLKKVAKGLEIGLVVSGPLPKKLPSLSKEVGCRGTWHGKPCFCHLIAA